MDNDLVFRYQNPIRNPHGWDTVSIAGTETPGLAELSEPVRAYEWDVKVGKGAYGSTTTFTGRVPAKFTMKITIWREDQFAELEDLYSRLKYDPTKLAFDPTTGYLNGINAVDIYHPSLAVVNIGSVVVEKIGAPVHQGKGLYTAEIGFIEYYPPPRVPVVNTPAKSTPIESGVKVSAEVQAAQAKLELARKAEAASQ